MGKSQLHEAAAKLARIFDAMGIDYAIAGALALAAHGRRRMTEDVVVLVTPSDLERPTAPHRGQDLVDVMELVRALDLPREFADDLDPSVRAEFDKQWQLARIVDDA